MPRNNSVPLNNKSKKRKVEDTESEDSEYSNYEKDFSSSDSNDEESVKKKEKNCKKTEKEKDRKKISKEENESLKKKEASKSSKKSTCAKKYDSHDYDESGIILDMSKSHSTQPKKIKLANNLLLERRILNVKDKDKKEFSYPSIIFVRKTNDSKAFEFNFPLSLVPRVIDALKYMLDDPKTSNM